MESQEENLWKFATHNNLQTSQFSVCSPAVVGAPSLLSDRAQTQTVRTSDISPQRAHTRATATSLYLNYTHSWTWPELKGAKTIWSSSSGLLMSNRSMLHWGTAHLYQMISHQSLNIASALPAMKAKVILPLPLSLLCFSLSHRRTTQCRWLQ